MITYYQTAPAAAVQPMFDGHSYIWTSMEMYSLPGGLRSARESFGPPRMMRVSYVANGAAYAELGKAGDAIACTVNLPFAVVAIHTDDDPVRGLADNEHKVSYAYPTSEDAQKHGRSKTGCFTLVASGLEKSFETLLQATQAAVTLGTVPNRWSMDHPMNAAMIPMYA